MYQSNQSGGFTKQLNSSSGQQGCSKFQKKECHESFCNCGLVQISCNEGSHEVKLVVEDSLALKSICFVTVNGEVFAKVQTPTAWIYDNDDLDVEHQTMEIEKKRDRNANNNQRQWGHLQQNPPVHMNHSVASLSQPRKGFQPKPPRFESRVVTYQTKPTPYELNKEKERRQREEELRKLIVDAPSEVIRIINQHHQEHQNYGSSRVQSPRPEFGQANNYSENQRTDERRFEEPHFREQRIHEPRYGEQRTEESRYGERRTEEFHYGERKAEEPRHQEVPQKQRHQMESMVSGQDSYSRIRPHIRATQPVKAQLETSSDEWNTEVETEKPEVNDCNNSEW